MKPEIKNRIRKEFEDLMRNRYKKLEEIAIEGLNFNPFLIRALKLNTPRKIAEFMVAQRTERSIVTSYGLRIQKIATLLTERGTGVEGADICKEKDGKRYYIQMKSGPNTPNKDITESTNKLLQSATRRNRGSVALLGMTYGNTDRVSSIIKGYSKVDWIVGSKFWDFISDDTETAVELFKIVAEVSDHYIPDKGEPYDVRYEKKITEIEKAIEKKYGKGGNQMWNRLFTDNM